MRLSMRHLICTLIGLIGVVVVVALTPRLSFLPKGMVLPAKTIRKPISASQVMIYREPPSGEVERLGQVRAELAFKVESQSVRDQLIKKIKRMAASIGANGVVVRLFVENDGMKNVLTFIGTAIYAHQADQ